MSSCLQEKDIIITKDYVINPNWDREDNSFKIIRMKFKDSKDSIDIKKATQSELLEELTEDSSFSYVANIKYNGKSYAERKIYFNKDNGFLWRSDWRYDRGERSKTVLGELEKNTWYLLAGLSDFRTLYYIYIDGYDKVYVYEILASNW